MTIEGGAGPEREKLEQSIAALEAQSAVLGDAIEPALAALRSQLAALATPIETEDQRKQITVVFADVKGFTNMSRFMDPEDVAEAMNSLWAKVDEVITDHGGRVDKHIGDAVMALFGAPIAREDDPERAVLAALEMQEMIRAFVKSHGPEVSELQMRVGINTGLAMLGTVGSTNEYTAIGHTVNLASRLEGLAEPGGILISQSTMNQVAGLFNVEAVEPLDVKGVDEPVPAYQVKSAKPRTFRVGPREVAGIATGMVGRTGELDLLRSLLPESPTDEPGPVRLVTIIGDPGVGKSRLVYEYFNHLESSAHPTWLFRGRAVESSRDSPYSVLRSVLSDRFLIADSDPPDVARAKLEDGLGEYGGDEVSRGAPFLGHLMGLDYTGHPAVAGILGEPKLIRDKGFKALANLVASGRSDAFVVFLIEDIHWADEESLELIEYLSTGMPDRPAVILCTARPELLQTRPGWDADTVERRSIHLEPLDDEATDALIDDVFQRLDGAPPELKDLIAKRSEGNPFFLEELVKMLIDEGVIDTSDGDWTVRMDTFNRTTIPGTLTGVLQARLDALPREERGVLQRSSVIGRVFWEEAADRLAAVGITGQQAPMRELAPSLKQHELAYERDPSAFSFTREFIFKHAILHDVAYESVVKRSRRVYHHEVAGWLTEAAGDREGEFAGQIAEHYDRAGDGAEATEWLVRAGDRARKSHAPDAAARAYRRALEISDGLDSADLGAARMAALEGLGDVLTMQARYEDAIDTYRRLRDDAEANGDNLGLATAEHGIATAETHRGRPREAVESAGRSRAAARRAEDRSLEAKALFIEAWSSIRLGSFEDGVRLANEMLEISREVGDRIQLAEALNLQGVIAASTGDYDEATFNFAEAAATYEDAGNEEKLMPILNNLGVIAELRGDYDKAEQRYSEALERAREISDRDAELVYSSNLGGVKVVLGHLVEGEEILRGVIDLAPGEFSLLSETQRLLAESLIAQGRLDEARSPVQTALDLALATGAHDHIAGAWRVFGQLASAAGAEVDVEVGGESARHTAEALFARSLEVAESVESDADRAKTLTSWALHDLTNGALDSSARRWEEARSLLSGLGAELEVERLEKVLEDRTPAG